MTKRVLGDDQIDSFLKRNQPLAPAIDEKKVHATLLAKLGFATAPARVQTSRARATWFAFSGLLAAGLAAFIVMSKPLNVPTSPRATPQTAAVETDWDEELFADEVPAMEVGEDFIELMAQNDVSGQVTK